MWAHITCTLAFVDPRLNCRIIPQSIPLLYDYLTFFVYVCSTPAAWGTITTPRNSPEVLKISNVRVLYLFPQQLSRHQSCSSEMLLTLEG